MPRDEKTKKNIFEKFPAGRLASSRQPESFPNVKSTTRHRVYLKQYQFRYTSNIVTRSGFDALLIGVGLATADYCV